MSKRGFTLIELLVVIAIIGILASIVLVSFPGATKRANDARVKSAIAQARTEMTAYHANNNGTYVGFVPSASITTEVANNCHGSGCALDYDALDSVSACIFAPLNEKDGTTWYCADSRGMSGTVALDPDAAGNGCDATPFVCPAFTAN